MNKVDFCNNKYSFFNDIFVSSLVVTFLYVLIKALFKFYAPIFLWPSRICLFLQVLITCPLILAYFCQLTKLMLSPCCVTIHKNTIQNAFLTFFKLNPQHTIPTIVDDGFALAESRAICIYLIEKYGQSSRLYPSDNVQQRAKINSRLMFDLTTLYPSVFKHLMTIYKKKPAHEENLKTLNKALGMLNEMLSESKYLAGDSLTLADIPVFVSVTTSEAIGIDVAGYENVSAWLTMLRETVPGREINAAGLEVTQKWMLSASRFARNDGMAKR